MPHPSQLLLISFYYKWKKIGLHYMCELRFIFCNGSVLLDLSLRAQHLADILSSKGLPAVCISGEIQSVDVEL